MLELKLFGYPELFYKGQKLIWPSKKSKALFIYLFLSKQVTKSLLSEIFWGDKDSDDKAMQSLRNCLYTLRKSMPIELIISVDQKRLSINPNLAIQSDFEQLNNKDLNLFLFEDYNLMENYYLNNNTLFNEWVTLKQQEAKNKLSDYIHDQLLLLFEQKAYSRIETIANKVMKLDEYDERSYKILIKIYDATNQFNKIVKLYESLEKLYREELGISPSDEIRSLVSKARANKTPLVNVLQSPHMVSREYELSILQRSINNFYSSKMNTSIIISGESGFGKSTLLNTLIKQQDDIKFYKVNCYHAEKNFILKPWHKLIHQIVNDNLESFNKISNQMLAPIISVFPFLRTDDRVKDIEIDNIIYPHYEVIEREIVFLLEKILHKKKIIIIIEDINDIDDISYSLIQSILREQLSSIMFILTSTRPISSTLAQLIYDMKKNNALIHLPLKAFSYKEMEQTVQRFYPILKLTPTELDILFKKSGGNPYYIKEILDNYRSTGTMDDMTDNISNLLAQKITYLSKDEIKILEMLSIHFDGASLTFFLKLSLIDEIKLVNILEQLIEKQFIIEELRNQTIYYQFKHIQFHTYIYSNLSFAKKKILHNVSAEIFEKLYLAKNNSKWLTQIIHHYDCANNISKSVEYAIEYLYNYLCISHEFFPVVDKRQSSPVEMENGYILKHFERIEQWIQSFYTDQINQRTRELMSKFYHMISRYHIRLGNYDDGLKHIYSLKALNGGIHLHTENILNANRQLVCVFMNRYNHNKLYDIIMESYNQITDEDFEQLGIWHRIEGYYYLMIKDFDYSREKLYKSISYFEKSNNQYKYLVNKAASYNWIGESYRLEGNIQEAISYYKQAIKLCEEENILGGLPIFYANYGQCLFENHETDKAYKCFKQSLELYNQTDSLWGRSIPYTYIGVIYANRKQYDLSLKAFKKSKMFSTLLQSPYEKGLLKIALQPLSNKLGFKTLYQSL